MVSNIFTAYFRHHVGMMASNWPSYGFGMGQAPLDPPDSAVCGSDAHVFQPSELITTRTWRTSTGAGDARKEGIFGIPNHGKSELVQSCSRYQLLMSHLLVYTQGRGELFNVDFLENDSLPGWLHPETWRCTATWKMIWARINATDNWFSAQRSLVTSINHN